MTYDLMEFGQATQSSIQCIMHQTGALPQNTVEIGVYTGYFTLNMVHSICPQLPNYKHISIDPFQAYNEFDQAHIQQIKAKFLNNLKQCPYKDNIEFINEASSTALVKLIGRGHEADLVYVDGDHRSNAVLQDLVLSWQILKVGGVLLADDSQNWCYTDKNGVKSAQMSPRLAVDSFVHCFWHKLEIIALPNGFQTAFVKREN